MPINQRSAYQLLIEAINSTSVPMLEFVSHAEAHDNYAWQVVRDSLTKLKYPPHEASRLAGKFKGSARYRIERLIEEKFVLLDAKPYVPTVTASEGVQAHNSM